MARSGSDSSAFEKIAPQMGPARHLGDRPILVEMVVHGVCISDEVTSVASQKLVDGGAVVAFGEPIKDMLLGRHQHPEVAIFAAFLRENQNARRVDAKVR